MERDIHGALQSLVKLPPGRLREDLSAGGGIPVAEPSHAVFLSHASQDAEAVQRNCDARRNDANATFAWLDRAWTNRNAGITYLLYDPFLLRYKDHPRFAAFCKQVGLPTPAEVAAWKKSTGS